MGNMRDGRYMCAGRLNRYQKSAGNDSDLQSHTAPTESFLLRYICSGNRELDREGGATDARLPFSPRQVVFEVSEIHGWRLTQFYF